MAKKDIATPETETSEAPKAGTAKGSLLTNTTWNGKVLKAGTPAPEGLLEWIKSNEKKSGKTLADYVVV